MVSPAQVQKNIQDILTLSVEHTSDKTALIIFDRQSELARIVSQGYRECLPKSPSMIFDEVPPEEILAAFEALHEGDLVVLIQSSSFRLNAFRIRVELFKRKLKVIEHPHLGRMEGEEISCYLDALAYDPAYFRNTGNALKARLDAASLVVVDSDGALLRYESKFESTKLNTGDYSTLNNVGGQFPIGEVFTEPKNLESVNGDIRIFAFGDIHFRVNKPAAPITLVVEKGRITSVKNSTPEFDLILSQIRADEGEVWIRELGFGLNRAFTPERIVCDIGSYERMCGVHLSLGTKHAVYKKPNFNHRAGGYHVDVFPVTKTVTIDDEVVFNRDRWLVG